MKKVIITLFTCALFLNGYAFSSSIENLNENVHFKKIIEIESSFVFNYLNSLENSNYEISNFESDELEFLATEILCMESEKELKSIFQSLENEYKLLYKDLGFSNEKNQKELNNLQQEISELVFSNILASSECKTTCAQTAQSCAAEFENIPNNWAGQAVRLIGVTLCAAEKLTCDANCDLEQMKQDIISGGL